MSKEKILITGASGFVGRNVCEYLKQHRYNVLAPSSKELDCLDEASVETYLIKNKIDIVLHFAVYGDGIDKWKDGTKILEYNLRIFHNFAKCSHLYQRMFYAGSGAEFDKRFPICGVSEEDIGKTIPVDQYGLMKYTINQYIEKSNNIYNLRLFGIFGKYEYYPIKFISNVCCKAIKGLPLTMRQNVYFDYLWIDDFCRMLEMVLYRELQYHTYNIVSGQKVSLWEICDCVRKISNKELDVYVCKDGLANEYTASNERFMKECTDFIYTPIEKSIESLYHWYVEHEELIDIYRLLY